MRSVLIYLFLLWSTAVSAQFTNELKGDSTDIYVHTFDEYCKHVSNTLPSVKKLYIVSQSFYSSMLPRSCGNISIQRISQSELSNLCSKNKYVFVTEMIALRTRIDGFYISVIPFKVEKKGKGFHYINEGGMTFNYVFDPKKALFYFKSVTGGIPEME